MSHLVMSISRSCPNIDDGFCQRKASLAQEKDAVGLIKVQRMIHVLVEVRDRSNRTKRELRARM